MKSSILFKFSFWELLVSDSWFEDIIKLIELPSFFSGWHMKIVCNHQTMRDLTILDPIWVCVFRSLTYLTFRLLVSDMKV